MLQVSCPSCSQRCVVEDESYSTTCPACGLSWILAATQKSPSTSAGKEDRELTATRTLAAKSGGAKSKRLPVPELPVEIGRYSPIAVLGIGGFATVYLAMDPALGRKVAIKVPRVDKHWDQEDWNKFLDEAKAVAELEHPGIVPVYDVGETSDGHKFFVMQYIPGRSLHDRLRERSYSFAESAELIGKIASVLRFAHKRGFFHRDLKPRNIMLDREGEPRVADFGLAVRYSEQAERAGEFAGTPRYMAPEQIRGEAHHLDGRADIWSLGVIFYQMLTHEMPFHGDERQLIDEILHRSPRPPRQINDRIPKELERICLKCLRKDVNERYYSAVDLLDDLAEWKKGTSEAEPATDSPPLLGSAGSPDVAPAEGIDRRVPAHQRQEDSHRTDTPSGHDSVGKTGDATVSYRLHRTKRDPRIMTWIVVGLVLIAMPVSLGIMAFGFGALSGAANTTAEVNDASSEQGGGDASEVITDEIARTSIDAAARPFVWHTLLDQRPLQLGWDNYDASRWSYDPQRNEVSMSVVMSGLLEIGETEHTDYELQVTMGSTDWNGAMGLFWGYQPDPDGQGPKEAECESVYLLGYKSGSKHEVRVAWSRLTIGEFSGTPEVIDVGIAQRWTEIVEMPDGFEATLEVEVADGTRLREIRWCGKALPDFAMQQEREAPTRGKMGLFVQHGSAVLRDARIRILEK